MNQGTRRDPYRLLGEMFGARYRLDDFAGMGSFGVVYRATDTRLGRTVAVKILKPDIKESDAAAARELFQREALTAGRLVHPYIVAVTDTGEENGFAYLIMEWLEGRTLEDEMNQRIQNHTLYAPDEVANLLALIADALQTAHDAGVIHRDIKPSNIHLGRSDCTHVKVLDFGIAKVVSSGSMVEASRIAGTLAYMSPEQLNGSPLDRRADIYALGIMLHQMLAGSLPFTGSTQGQIAQQHLAVAPPLLHNLRSDVSPALSDVLQRALAKDPNARQQTTNDLYREFVEALSSNARATIPLTATSHRQATPTVANAPAVSSWSDVSPYAEVSSAPTQVSFETIASGDAPSPLQNQSQSSPINRTAAKLVQHTEQISNSLRPARNFALISTVVFFFLSIAVGLIARWLGITTQPYAYDEFAVEIITIAVRDCVFGAFLGVTLSEFFGSTKPRFDITEGTRTRAFVAYGALFATLFMLPFVLLRTSMLIYALLLGIIGFVIGIVVCGIRLGAQKVKNAASKA